MNKIKTYQKKYAFELHKLAQDDLLAAVTLDRSDETRRDITLYLISQAIEKSIKAVLCFQEIPIPLTHNLTKLVDLLPTADHLVEFENMYDIGDLATVRRYEEGSFLLTKEEITKYLA